MSSKPHILIFPYPAQGHLLPLLDLTHHLALKSITITIIITPKNLPTLNNLLSTHPTAINTLTLPFPSHPNIPPGAENIRDIGNTGNYPFINALSKLQNPIIHWFNSHNNPPVALISDFFLGWTQQLATQLGIPRIGFYSSNAFLTAIMIRCWRDLLPPPPPHAVVQFPGLPGTPSFKREHLPSMFLRYRELDSESEFVKKSYEANAESWGCIYNTFRELDGMYLDHLQVQFGHQRFFAVGPLCSNRVESDPDGRSEVLKWLDQWEEDGSVLYVCFGSQKVLRKEQIESLAFGLEHSGTRFIWVLKDGNGSLPNGFEDRVSGRGLIVKGWVPQVAILGHRVVGGFLSHCGWNSVLEAMVAGVAILGWPMEADQFVNAKLLVEDIGVAVRICEGADSVPDPDELGRVIAGLMGGDSLQKRRGKVMREEAFKVVGKDGNSSKELDELVKALMQLGVRE
ncbi:hypothetical protein TanjilG_06760 [Lupinus angustifolius]|uniref:Glycosyltransferase n=2 Tax=Lupinus angustifolius TaxID=3871 RepID=A0A1J7GW44_LUPAN|nr:hypothetical protein TanjilG_06760 [Lupinus angustifolius]